MEREIESLTSEDISKSRKTIDEIYKLLKDNRSIDNDLERTLKKIYGKIEKVNSERTPENATINTA